jgi:signal peptidase I
MTSPNLLVLLLWVLAGLLPCLTGLLPSVFDRQTSRLSKCLLFILIVAYGILSTKVAELFQTPQAEKNAIWFQEVYWTLGIGYAFSLPTTVYLLKTRKGKNTTTANAASEDTLQRLRDKLLHFMDTEVNKRLNDSLHNDQLIPLVIEEQRKQVGRPEKKTIYNPPANPFRKFLKLNLLKLIGGRQTPLNPEEKVIDVFNRDDVRGRLLILGAPGAGKTTTLLELARDLIERAQQQPNQPIPVLFELSNWKDDKQSIADWLVADLKFRFKVPEVITSNWITTGQLLPLLDGLDELGLTRQVKCIEKINDFLQERPGQSLIVCCRQEEYSQGETTLDQLRGAVSLQPLTEMQIEDYLKQLGASDLWKPIKDDPEGLLKLAKIPLFLYIIPFAYPNGLMRSQRQLNTIQEREEYYKQCRQELFDAYIEHRFKKHSPQQSYTEQETRRYLTWLANKLKDKKQTEFIIEKMQPTWLENPTQKWLYYIGVGLIAGLVVELTGGLIAGLIGASLSLELIIGFASGLIWWLGLVVMGSTEEIKLQETFKLSWSWQKMQKPIIIGLSGGLLVGLGLGLTRDFLNLSAPGTMVDIIYGSILGISLGIISGIINIFSIPDIDINTRSFPNQGILNSARNATIAWIIAVPITTVIFWLLAMMPEHIPLLLLSPLLGGVGLFAGGLACVQHFTLRIICWCNGYSPWSYYHFLEYATERRILRRVGGRYRFVHNLLQEHFAALQLPQAVNYSNNPPVKGVIAIFTCVIFTLSAIFIPFVVPDANLMTSQAMMPTIQKNDRLLINKRVNHSQIHQRGDIILFDVTETMEHKGAKYGLYFRRIVGRPREQVEIKKGLVYIDGKVLPEDYISVPGTYEHKLVQVPADSYFYLGDNRNYNEFDLGGLVPQDHIKGQVIFRYWPPNRMGKVD